MVTTLTVQRPASMLSSRQRRAHHEQCDGMCHAASGGVQRWTMTSQISPLPSSVAAGSGSPFYTNYQLRRSEGTTPHWTRARDRGGAERRMMTSFQSNGQERDSSPCTVTKMEIHRCHRAGSKLQRDGLASETRSEGASHYHARCSPSARNSFFNTGTPVPARHVKNRKRELG